MFIFLCGAPNFNFQIFPVKITTDSHLQVRLDLTVGIGEVQSSWNAELPALLKATLLLWRVFTRCHHKPTTFTNLWKSCPVATRLSLAGQHGLFHYKGWAIGCLFLCRKKNSFSFQGKGLIAFHAGFKQIICFWDHKSSKRMWVKNDIHLYSLIFSPTPLLCNGTLNVCMNDWRQSKRKNCMHLQERDFLFWFRYEKLAWGVALVHNLRWLPQHEI